MYGAYPAGRIAQRRRGFGDSGSLVSGINSYLTNNAVASDISALANAVDSSYNTVSGNLPSATAVSISSILPVIVGAIVLIYLLKK